MIQFLSNYNYTIQKKPHIDRLIASQVSEVVDKILARYKDVISIFLLGGYARGEGSVMETPEGIIPLGDYDLLVVTQYPHNVIIIPEIESLGRKFMIQYEIGVDHIWKLLLPFMERRIYWYEAKFGSKLLYGNGDVLNMIRVRGGNDIDLNEGFSLMFNRLMGSLKVFEPTYFEHGVNDEQSMHLIFQSIKAILACGDSLLLLAGKYHYKYAERCRRLYNDYGAHFPELAEKGWPLHEDYRTATDIKLKPDFHISDPIGYWFKANKYILQTVLYYLGKTTHTANLTLTDDLGAFPQAFYSASRPHILDYLIFNWRALKGNRSFGGFSNTAKSFSDIVRISLFNLALSIDEDGDISEELLNNAINILDNVVPVNKAKEEKDPMKKWHQARDAAYSAWSLSRH